MSDPDSPQKPDPKKEKTNISLNTSYCDTIIHQPNTMSQEKKSSDYTGKSDRDLLVMLITEVREIKTDQVSLRQEFNDSLSNLRMELNKTFAEKVNQLKTNITARISEIETKQISIDQNVQLLDLQLESIEKDNSSKDPLCNIDVCIIAKNLLYHDQEDPIAICK